MAWAWAQVIVPSIVAKYVEQGATAFVNQFRYMCCLKRFQNELNEEERGVIALQQDLEHKLEQERKNAKAANKTVENWIQDTKEVLNNVLVLQTTIKEDQHCLNNSCPNWFWRYSRSKEAKGLTTNLKNLKDEHNKLPQELTHEINLPNIGFIQSDGFMPSRASEFALGEIMTALETDGVNVIGLHGMPGAGKTTLAKQVQKEAMKKELFNEYLIVVVSEKPNASRIQSRLAEQLELNLGEATSTELMASKLMFRLMDENKKLLVLDDVWGELNLSEMGIPPVHDLNNCKILLTTPRIPACEAMKCQRTILLDILTDDEAWTLFKDAANLNDGYLTDVAKKVAKECRGLPLAIMSVGKALRGKTRKNAWVQALKKLREGEIEHIGDISRTENAYKSLKFSFDALPREKTKRCLLLCAFFPQDYAIFVPQLAGYAIQLGIYERSSSTTTRDIRGEVLEEVDELRNSHLLLESEILQEAFTMYDLARDEILEEAFTMHDLVHDVVLKLGKTYSVFRDPKTKKFQWESQIVRRMVDKHFRNNGFTNTPNESSSIADVPIKEFTESRELVLNKSAESALVQMITALQTDGINMIGLHGLTRVGKTSWAKQVAYGAVRMKLFDECAFVHVPIDSDTRVIQSHIASNLNLEFEEGSSTEQPATELRHRLLDEKRKILVLDNVEQKLNLDEIGIPSMAKLKILITTPRKSVCKAMKCQRKILLEPLTKDEERSLIDMIKNSTLKESRKFAAYKIVEQFKRCPGAFKAGRLIDCKNDSETMLLLSHVQHEPESNFNRMKCTSKEFSVEQKRCMLLCSLYAAEDEEISVEELGRYAHILGIYGSARSFQYTMKQLMKAIDKLSDYHFLFPATRERHIQVHAAARNFALLYSESTGDTLSI